VVILPCALVSTTGTSSIRRRSCKHKYATTSKQASKQAKEGRAAQSRAFDFSCGFSGGRWKLCLSAMNLFNNTPTAGPKKMGGKRKKGRKRRRKIRKKNDF
jgi:hypothetical protein